MYIFFCGLYVYVFCMFEKKTYNTYLHGYRLLVQKMNPILCNKLPTTYNMAHKNS